MIEISELSVILHLISYSEDVRGYQHFLVAEKLMFVGLKAIKIYFH